MNCTKCNEEIQSHWQVCPSCQNPVPQITRCECGEELKPNWKVCPACQKSIKLVAPLESAREVQKDFCGVCGTLTGDKAFKCEECGKVCCVTCRVKHPEDKVLPLCSSCGDPVVQPLWDKKREEEAAKEKEAARERAEQERLAEERRKGEEEERRKAEELAKLAPEMVFVRGGSYQMGDVFGDGYDDEQPVHEVVLDDFYIGKYTVTFEEYDRYCEETGAASPDDEGWGRGRRPVMNVSWEDAQEYIKWLNQITGKKYRLPTEAEWEYACRSGGKKEKYSGSDKADSVARHHGNSGYKTHPVGQKSGNGLGLYDMSGNVREWVNDWYGKDYYGNSPKYNPQGPDNGEDRMLRGGSWCCRPVLVRSSFRDWDTPNSRSNTIGFRVALPPED